MAYIIKPSGDLTGYCFLENAVEEGVILTKPHSMLIMKVETSACMARDNTGTPYGAPNSTGCTLVLQGNNQREIRTLFNRMNNNVPEAISILYNPKFDEDTDNLISYDLGVVYRGYIVDIWEHFETTGKDGTAKIQLTIKLLITKCTYIGENDQRIHLHISE